jgi:ribosomal protein RSM22 (predicted rRNA methylase)
MRRGKSGIHSGLVGARGLVGKDYLARPELRQEYESEIAPRTEESLRRILARASIPRPRRVLDLGAGTGAVGRVIREVFHEVELVAVDRVAGPGILVADVARAVRPSGVTGRFDLIVAAHLLNELGARLDVDGRAALVAGWCRELLAPEGRCIVIEPALRETSRELLGVRDRLLAAGLGVLAPCLFRAACPALSRERDWCHDSAEVLVAGRSRVDFSYVVLGHAQPQLDPSRYRVVSDPLKDKGRLRLFLCGPRGRLTLMRLDRDRSEANQALDQARRGDVLVIPEFLDLTDDTRIGPQTALALEPAKLGEPSALTDRP